MTSADLAQPLAQPAVQAALTAGGSGNPAPLGLAGFAATTVVLGVSLAALAPTFFVLGAGKKRRKRPNGEDRRLHGPSGGIPRAYLSRAEFCEAS